MTYQSTGKVQPGGARANVLNPPDLYEKLLGFGSGRGIIGCFVDELEEFAAFEGRCQSVSNLLTRFRLPGHFQFFYVGIRNFNVRPGF